MTELDKMLFYIRFLVQLCQLTEPLVPLCDGIDQKPPSQVWIAAASSRCAVADEAVE